jgi:tetratricopeptide (TPR) repeat protein
LLGVEHTGTIAALFNRCDSFREAGELRRAAQDFCCAREMRQKHCPDVWWLEVAEKPVEALLCGSFGDHSRAAEILCEFLEQTDKPQYEGRDRWQIRVMLTGEYAQEGDFKSAASVIETLLESKVKPVDLGRDWVVQLKKNLADHAFDAGKLDLAEQRYGELLRLPEPYPECAMWQGRCLRQLALIAVERREFAAVDAMLEKADSLDPADKWVSQHHRIRLLLAQNKLAKAAKLSAETRTLSHDNLVSHWKALERQLQLLELWSEASTDPEITKLVADFDADIRRRCDVPNLHQMRVLRCQARLALHKRDHQEALAKANEALAMQEKLLGKYHFALPETLDLIAAIYQSEGKPLASKVATARAEVIRKAYREG